MFHYLTGERVEIGDIVKFKYSDGWRRHLVVSIFAPYTKEAEHFQSRETGGIFLADDSNSTAGVVLCPPDGKDWDDVKFISRMQSKNL